MLPARRKRPSSSTGWGAQLGSGVKGAHVPADDGYPVMSLGTTPASTQAGVQVPAYAVVESSGSPAAEPAHDAEAQRSPMMLVTAAASSAPDVTVPASAVVVSSEVPAVVPGSVAVVQQSPVMLVTTLAPHPPDVQVPASAVVVSAGHPATAPVLGAVSQSSPGRNRQQFLMAMAPQLMTCDLSSAVVGMGVKHNLTAIVVAIYPAQTGPPARRHVLLCDKFGSTGLTVWHGDVQKFSKVVLGTVVTITRASVSVYQGKKNLVLSKDSSVVVGRPMGTSPVADWWSQLAQAAPLPLTAAAVAMDNAMINVFGIIGLISHEDKEVHGVVRRVTTVHLASPTAKLQLRGWDLEPDTLLQWHNRLDSVVKVCRIRMTSFAEAKIGEILDSPEGTVVSSHSDPELTAFWAE
jgi:hypothetical protein